MSETYEFSTFEEFFERVPADRMADCLAELAINFSLAKGTLSAMSEISKSLGGDAFKTIFSKPLVWDDDGKGEIKATINFGQVDGKDEVITIEAQRKVKR